MSNAADNTSPKQLIHELHQASRAAFLARDLVSYMSVFADDLRYHQQDGRTIGHQQLSRNVRDQFSRISAVDWSYLTESIETSLDEVLETAHQWGYVATSAFGFLHHLWSLQRRGQYRWRQTNKGWQIIEATVITERVLHHSSQFAWKPQLPSLDLLADAHC